jgi:hypothetical protein
MFYVAAAVAALLFLCMLFDPRRHRAIHQANVDMRRGQSLGNFPKVRLLDPEWGLFGTRAGTPALLAIRAVLLLELILALLLSGKYGPSRDVALLAFAAVFITVELGLVRLPVPSR